MFLERVLMAFLVSALCFGGSYYWYLKGGPQRTVVEKSRQVAVLASLKNEVQRKPSKRVIWESIVRDEVLYLNEAIKTGPEAEAVIEFTEDGKMGTKIYLEPDSVVVLEETGSDLTLDFVKGNVFVAGTEESGLKIKSGESTIAVGKGELNLNKAEDGEVDLRVLKGTASVEVDGKSTELGENQTGSLGDGKVNLSKVNLKVISPLSNRRVFVDFEKNEKVEISWEGLPEGYEIQVFAGQKRSELELLKDVEIDYQASRLKAPFRVGKVYWRLEAVAKKEDNKEERVQSPVTKNRIVSILPPKILQPENDEFIVLASDEPTYMFQFANPLNAKDLLLQVWPSNAKPTLQNTKNVEVDGSYFLHRFDKKGDFSAVLTGYIEGAEGKRMTLRSKVISFRVQIGQKLVPPELIYPEPLQTLAFEDVASKGVYLTWKSVPTIKQYEIRVEIKENGKKKVMKKKISDSTYWMKKIKPGEFTWSVSSIDDAGTPSEWSKRQKFTIGEVPRIEWADGKKSGDSLYVGVDPYVHLDWVSNNDEVVRWRAKVTPEGKFESERRWVRVKDSPYKKKVPVDGYYQAQVQGVGQSGAVIGQTSIRRIRVAEQPLLPAPLFAESIPAKLKATARGNLQLMWTQVDGAAEYMIQLKDDDNEVIDKVTAKSESTVLKSLKPGQYKVNIFALDLHGRKGLEGETRPIVVENKSDVRAPAFKKFKVRTFKSKGGK